MTNRSIYLSFLKDKGIPLSGINPGSDEMALSVDNAFLALDLLKDAYIAILGADVLTEDKSGKLVYAIHIWGYEYHYLNWYCDKNNNESETDYLQRSHELAKEGIAEAQKVAERLENKCYIVFVI